MLFVVVSVGSCAGRGKGWLLIFLFLPLFSDYFDDCWFKMSKQSAAYSGAGFCSQKPSQDGDLHSKREG
jgi:hypothetical protein